MAKYYKKRDQATRSTEGLKKTTKKKKKITKKCTRSRCDEAKHINRKPSHQMRPSRSCIIKSHAFGPELEGPYCGAGGSNPLWIGSVGPLHAVDIKMKRKKGGTVEERGILENSAVREDHDRRFFSVGPRHFGNFATSLPTSRFQHLSQGQFVWPAQTQQLVHLG